MVDKLLRLLFVWHVINDVSGDVGLSLPAQESYNEAHQQNAQPLHYLPAGTNILALCFFSLISHDTKDKLLVD